MYYVYRQIARPIDGYGPGSGRASGFALQRARPLEEPFGEGRTRESRRVIYSYSIPDRRSGRG